MYISLVNKVPNLASKTTQTDASFIMHLTKHLAPPTTTAEHLSIVTFLSRYYCRVEIHPVSEVNFKLNVFIIPYLNFDLGHWFQVRRDLRNQNEKSSLKRLWDDDYNFTTFNIALPFTLNWHPVEFTTSSIDTPSATSFSIRPSSLSTSKTAFNHNTFFFSKLVITNVNDGL